MTRICIPGSIPLLAALLLLSGPAFTLRAHPLDHWHVRATNPPPVASLPTADVAYGNGWFVVVGSVGLVATSADGQHWTTNYPTTNTLNAVTYGGGQFVAVGLKTTILTSTDATNWVERYHDPANFLINIAHENSRFVAVGVGNFTMVSEDGVSWSTTGSTSLTQNRAFAAGNGLFVRPDPPGTNLLTVDGTNWWRQPAASTDGTYTIGFGDGMFVTINTSNRVFCSIDATNWTLLSTNSIVRPEALAYGNGHWVAVSRGDQPHYSANLIDWHEAPAPANSVGVAFGNGAFVSTGSLILQSDPVILLQSIAPGTLSLSGPTNATYRIEATSDPGQTNGWQMLTDVFVDVSPYVWMDPDAGSFPNRLYRAQLLLP